MTWQQHYPCPPSPFYLQQPSANVINLFLCFLLPFFACTLSPWPSPFGIIFSGTASHTCCPSLRPPGLSFKYDLMAAPKRQGASSLALPSLALRGLLNQLGSCRAQQDNTLCRISQLYLYLYLHLQLYLYLCYEFVAP